MNPTPPTETSRPATGCRVVIIYKRNSPEAQLAYELEKQLSAAGFKVFLDQHLAPSAEWASEMAQQIRSADAVIPLLSGGSITNELVIYQVETAHETAQSYHGRPRFFPVRINYNGPLPEALSGILDVIPAPLWESDQDTASLIELLVQGLKNLPPAQPIRVVPTKGLRLVPRPTAVVHPKTSAAVPPPPAAVPASLETVGGAVPLHSEFYIPRPADKELQNALVRYDSIVLIKGARQMGKTSLLARGLQFARERGAKVALTDFQKLNAPSFESVSALYLSLAESLADQLELGVLPSDVWDEKRGPNVNFERFLRREVLEKLNAPLVWGMDEVDRLFVCPFGSEVFGLFRSWHNERALDPSCPWAGMTLGIAYATEAFLFITDMNQSPFNVGTRLTLEDFNVDQVSELNRRYRHPLANASELERFTKILGGHPYLVRRGLHEMSTRKIDIAAFETEAGKDEGIYADHLRRILVLLARDSALTEVVREVLRRRPCPTPESFYRLRSAGVIVGDSQNNPRMRCMLYEDYLRRHLL